MATLNLDDDNVFIVEISLDEARNLEIDHEEVSHTLDKAQGHVFMGNATIANLVIRIKK